ncbi:MAG: hypothetical protein ACQERN_06110 [Thermodesulfobacteriota bacterium]
MEQGQTDIGGTDQFEANPGGHPLPKILYGMLGLTAAALLFLFLFIPFSYAVKPVKVVLLGVLLLFAVLSILFHGRAQISKEVLALAGFFIVIASVFSFYGVLRGAPGALDKFRLYAVWPAVYIVLFSIMTRLGHLRLVLVTLVVATIAVSGYGILYVLTSLPILPDSWFIDFQGQSAIQTAAIGFHKGYIEYRLLSITGMPFLIPFTLAALVTWPKAVSPVPRSMLWVALALSVVAMIFTARRALFLVVAFAPVMIFIFQLFLAGSYAAVVRRNRRYAIVLALLLLPVAVGSINTFYDIDIGAMVQDVGAAFDPGQDRGARVRSKQIESFVREIAERPFFGSGLGASIADISRNPDKRQSTYELMYFTFVFHVGIVGFLLYSAGIAWLYLRAIEIFRSEGQLGVLSLPVFVGCACFLIANATNPYLASFEFMWTLFLPVGIVNLYLLQARDEKAL